MAQACEALGVPIVSGNVSLYNDTNGRSIHPTPVVGCVGLVPDVRRVPRGWREGDAILLAPLGARHARGLGVSGALRHARRAAGARPRVRGGSRRWLWRIAPRRVAGATTSPRAVSPSRSPRRRSGRGVGASSISATTRSTLFGEGGGQVIVALPADQRRGRRRRRGVDVRAASASSAAPTILGVPLDELRARLGE